MTERLDGYDNYSTTLVQIGRSRACAYCGDECLVIDDWFDEHGNYCGTRNYCTCEQAKIEQQMKRELEREHEKEIAIRKKYEDKLVIDKSKIEMLEVKEKFSNICRDHVQYGALSSSSFEDLCDLLKEAYEEQVHDYEYEEDEE
ncbi:hypothetical protein [Lysinibacillus sp. Bpr_S20]|uniref:hypothetical protein n=1 Tax=Lysinibacillus sp. Bpr_S20 TaxID=2933964 RepID=UPI002012083C|nr:hypothetical protein [Lysinibacillus sp. Bpr_S20]MCL1700743.1 hypothetical protein [Lysinibacillus sp. Bpr_S20]